MSKPIKGFSVFTIIVERDGIMIEHRTPEREVGGFKPTNTVFVSLT